LGRVVMVSKTLAKKSPLPKIRGGGIRGKSTLA
jgi:hypothetical protein